MMEFLGKAGKLFSYGSLIFVTRVAHAGTLPTTTVTNLTNLQGLICTIAGWIFGLLVVIAIVFVLIAAFYYLTAGGDPGKAKTANYMIVYAAVAIAIGLLARAIPTIVGGLFGATVTIATC